MIELGFDTIHDIVNGTAPIVVGFSGGKDSVAVVLFLLEHGVDRERIHLHHHDVDGAGENLFDWQCTTSYCQAFADYFRLKLFISYRKGGIFRAIMRNNEPKQDVYYQREPGGEYICIPSDPKAINTRLKFPAVGVNLMTRWCSAEVKIEIVRTVIANMDIYRDEVYILTGERRQESANRAKYEELELHATNGKRRKAIAWRPIIDFTEEMVWDIMKFYGVQPHPAYMLGWNRCSCQLCIFGSSNIWATINAISPHKVKQIADTEEDIQFTLYSKQTIMDKVAAGKPMLMDPEWVGQALGEFTKPIFVGKDWELPAGAYRKESSGSF